MNIFLKHFEAYLLLETTSKRKSFALIFLALILPGHIKYLFIFIMISKLLPNDVNLKNIKMILSLPFSRSETFIFSFILGFSLILAASVIGEAFFFGKTDFTVFPHLFVFYSAYFGILMLVTTKGADNITFPVFLLITDLIAGSLGNVETNPYSLVSPIYQKSLLFSAILSLLILSISFAVYVLDRREKW